jgi:hypothetical protein
MRQESILSGEGVVEKLATVGLPQVSWSLARSFISKDEKFVLP